jgi:hypothetical protein
VFCATVGIVTIGGVMVIELLLPIPVILGDELTALALYPAESIAPKGMLTLINELTMLLVQIKSPGI